MKYGVYSGVKAGSTWKRVFDFIEPEQWGSFAVQLERGVAPDRLSLAQDPGVPAETSRQSNLHGIGLPTRCASNPEHHDLERQ